MQRISLINKAISTLGVAVCSSALLLSLPNLAVAQTEPAQSAPAPAWNKHHGDPAAMQKRLDKLKADLKLQPNQEGAWQIFTSALKAQGDQMRALHQQNKASSNTATALPDRLDQRLAAMKQHVASMEETHNAIKTFYSQLTPEQRTVMDQHFARMQRHHRG
jgi:protein CpxP